MRERWQPVLNGYYEVSSLGVVRRLLSGPATHVGKILKPVIVKEYLAISACTGGLERQVKIHALVARAFLGKRPRGMQVNHKDGNKRNNKVSNLEYVTPKGNDAHARRIGLKSSVGERNGRAVLRPADVIAIRLRYQKYKHGTKNTLAALASEYGVSTSQVGNIVRGELWSHLKELP